LLFVYFGLIGAETNPVDARVAAVEKGYPAATTLQPGDKLISVDGVRGDPVEMSKQIGSHKCAQNPPTDGCKAAEPATLLVERDGQRVGEGLTPAYDASPGVGRTRRGFGYQAGPREAPPAGEAATTSLDRFGFITTQTLSLPAGISDSEPRKDISGIVGS